LGGGDSPTPADGHDILAAVAGIRDLPAVAEYVLKILDYAQGDPENLSLADIDPGMILEQK
jgi:hypothetical protein